MSKARREFDEPYKREAVRFLEETGRSLREVAQELRVCEGALWRWRAEAHDALRHFSPGTTGSAYIRRWAT